MIQIGKPADEMRDSSSSKRVIPSNLTTMDLESPQYLQASSLFPSKRVKPHLQNAFVCSLAFICHWLWLACYILILISHFWIFASQESPFEGNTSFYNRNKENPFADTFPDPLCQLNLKETSEFVKALPVTNDNTENKGFLEASAPRRRGGASSVALRRLEAPSTPGRPVFSFSVGNLPRKSFPSKWDDAEKWLISSSCHDSPAHVIKPPEPSNISKRNEVLHQKAEVFAEKFRVTEEKISRAVSSFHSSVSLERPNPAFNGVLGEVFLKGEIILSTVTLSLLFISTPPFYFSKYPPLYICLILL